MRELFVGAITRARAQLITGCSSQRLAVMALDLARKKGQGGSIDLTEEKTYAHTNCTHELHT